MKRSLPLILFGFIFLLAGCGLIGGGFLFRKSSKEFFQTAEATTATIDRIESYRTSVGTGTNKEYRQEHDVYISYEVEGQTFHDVELNYYSNTMFEGQEITIYYQPGNPANIRVKFGESLVFILLTVMGGIFAFVGLIIILLGFSFNPKHTLVKDGVRYNATVIDIVKNRNVSLNGRHPYYIDCQAQNPYTGQQMLFRSKNIYDNLQMYNLTTVPVYVHPKNPKKYYVDVSGAINELKQKENIADYR